jgi:hypothetical protein
MANEHVGLPPVDPTITQIAKILASGLQRIELSSKRSQPAVGNVESLASMDLDVRRETVLSVHGVNGTREPGKEHP